MHDQEAAEHYARLYKTIIRNCAFGIAAQMKMANHSLTANQ